MNDYEPEYDLGPCPHGQLFGPFLVEAGWVDPFGDLHPDESARDLWEEVYEVECGDCGWRDAQAHYFDRIEVREPEIEIEAGGCE